MRGGTSSSALVTSGPAVPPTTETMAVCINSRVEPSLFGIGLRRGLGGQRTVRQRPGLEGWGGMSIGDFHACLTSLPTSQYPCNSGAILTESLAPHPVFHQKSVSSFSQWLEDSSGNTKITLVYIFSLSLGFANVCICKNYTIL